jgi:hypothetical protein
MALPDSYTVKYGSLAAYFDAIQGAQPPDRFAVKFLENLEFKSTNDRTIIGILKELGFLDPNNVPTSRYYQFLDKTDGPKVLAEGIKEMYSDLFAVKKDAHKLTADEAFNKLRTIYAGKKNDTTIKLIAKTFAGLCELADFESKLDFVKPEAKEEEKQVKDKEQDVDSSKDTQKSRERKINLDTLQYHINIVLPETRDQGVYDAIFKSLRDHLG